MALLAVAGALRVPLSAVQEELAVLRREGRREGLSGKCKSVWYRLVCATRLNGVYHIFAQSIHNGHHWQARVKIHVQSISNIG